MLPWLSYPQSIRSCVIQRISGRFFKNLREIVVVMYQALYTKACEDAWKHKDLYAEVLLRLGTYNFQTSIHNWQTVPRRWFARYLHWIRNNRRRFSLRRPRRRYTIVRFEFTGASMRPYCGSSGNSSLPGKRITIQTSWSTYAQSTLRLKKWLKLSVCRSTITSWTASPCCRCTNCGVNTRSISATRTAFSCPPFGCPTSTLLGMCC